MIDFLLLLKTVGEQRSLDVFNFKMNKENMGHLVAKLLPEGGEQVSQLGGGDETVPVLRIKKNN